MARRHVQVTGVILHGDGLIDDVHAGLFYASVQEMKADMRGQGVDLDISPSKTSACLHRQAGRYASAPFITPRAASSEP